MFVTTSLRRASRAVAAIAALSTVAVLSGCSSSGTTASAPTSSTVPKAVVDNLAAHAGKVDVTYKGTSFDASAARGKKVWWVTHAGANPVLATLGTNFATALKLAGVTVVPCDGKGNPVDENNCITQAVSQKADLIQVDGAGTPDTYANSLAVANAAKIPVLAGASVDATITPLYKGLAGQSSQGFVLNGELMADWITKDAGGGAHVLFLTVPDVDGSIAEQKAFSARLAKNCSSCTVTVTGVTLPNWASDLGTTVNAALLRDPKIDYVVPAFDPMTQFTNPAIQQAGKGSSVKVVTSVGSPPAMTELKGGSGVIVADVGTDFHALAYLEADLALRALTGNPTVEDAIAPGRVFDAKNTADLTVDPASFASGAWYSDPTKTVAFFKNLWQL